MDKGRMSSAINIMNDYSEEQLTRIFSENTELRQNKKLAQAIVNRRKQKRIESVDELKEIILQTIKSVNLNQEFAKIFQAIRIEVNQEFANLKEALKQSIRILKPSGRLVVISYHSLEDKIVKDIFTTASAYKGKKPRLKILTSKPILPSADEVESNPQARSAKLRVAEKL